MGPIRCVDARAIQPSRHTGVGCVSTKSLVGQLYAMRAALCVYGGGELNPKPTVPRTFHVRCIGSWPNWLTLFCSSAAGAGSGPSCPEVS